MSRDNCTYFSTVGATDVPVAFKKPRSNAEQKESVSSCFFRFTKSAYRRFSSKHYGVEKSDNSSK